MLVFNPQNRITINDALAHPNLKQLHNPRTEPTCQYRFDFEFEKCDLNKDVMQDLMWEEILHFKPEFGRCGFRRSTADSTIAKPFLNN
jgi:hypothetical protein